MNATSTLDLRLALVGLPNCGKTALFNRLTGSRQKVANYPGVTVERKEGSFVIANGRRVRVLDLPGTYSMKPTTLDEAITRDVALGRLADEPRPELLVLVADTTHLALSLRLALETKRLGLPLVIALNMSDIARKRGFEIDRSALEHALGVPVVDTVAIRRGGANSLLRALVDFDARRPTTDRVVDWRDPTVEEVREMHAEAARVLRECGYREPRRSEFVARVDRVLLHPLWGMLVLGAILFLVFQAVFSWAAPPMDWIRSAIGALGEVVRTAIPAGPLQSLLVDGVIAGAGAVLVFLPQILILFAFILALEDSGYLPRAAYLLDRVMGSVGLSGRAFIPLLSSFACAVPGIMATRTIPTPRDRIATIMVAPLMTCSARLPVYALLIGAFVPARDMFGFNLQGVVLFALYFAGVLGALGVAWVMKRMQRGLKHHLLMLELPDYQWPDPTNLLLGLWDRTKTFIGRVGGVILALMVVLWFLSTYPAPPPGATGVPIEYSFAGRLGKAIATLFEPIGFNWQIVIALIPGLAAREVAIGALATVYALSASDAAGGDALASAIATQWSMPTALALLAWYVFAPQCLSTLAVVKRETNGWRHPLIMAGYLFALAYVAAFITYRIAVVLVGF